MKADEIRQLGKDLVANLPDIEDKLFAKLGAEFVAQLAEMNARFADDARQFNDMVEKGKGVSA